MKRRTFIAGLGSAAAWPVVARGQQNVRVRRIGMLSVFSESDSAIRSLSTETWKALSQLGWESGRNIQTIERWAGGNHDAMPSLAKELIAWRPDVVIGVGGPAAAALQNETHAIPIIFVSVVDPVGEGLVSSISRPGGNITGFSNTEAAFGGKLISLLKRVAPRLTISGRHIQSRNGNWAWNVSLRFV